MVSLLRTRFGIPGVISVIALVLAMAGGAYAAKKYVITSTSQIKPNVLKQLKGSSGPIGATGGAGAKGDPGAGGKDGSAGTPGAPGNNGQSVTSEEFGAGGKEGHCVGVGGTKFVSASGSSFACNGKEGSPFTAGGKLPSGSTETGTWGGATLENQVGFFPISMTFPTSAVLTATLVKPGQTATGCPGVVGGVPTADAGNLCVYAGLFAGAFPPDGQDGAPTFLDPNAEGVPGVSVSGAILSYVCTSPECFTFGSWAATAP